MPMDRKQAFSELVTPTLAHAFSDPARVQSILGKVEFRDFRDEDEKIPRTIDAGSGAPPIIVMSWQNTVSDLICLMHEASHAVQIVLSDHTLMPPVARETCAFLGEQLLITTVRAYNPALAQALTQVWEQQNSIYAGDNLRMLSNDLKKSETPYRYRQNYAVARLFALHLRHVQSGWLQNLYASGVNAMNLLPMEILAARTGLPAANGTVRTSDNGIKCFSEKLRGK